MITVLRKRLLSPRHKNYTMSWKKIIMTTMITAMTTNARRDFNLLSHIQKKTKCIFLYMREQKKGYK